MALPSSQKYLIKVDRSKTKTIKFKNGFPPKIVRARESFDDTSTTIQHQRLQLVECEPQPKSNASNPLLRNKNSQYKDKLPSNVSSAEKLSGGQRVGFAPSAVKQSCGHQRSATMPFSPPPTMSELRSLTKKVGRFYTVNTTVASRLLTPTLANQQRVILDIEKALSDEDLHGLENCYKRIFNGNVDPIRTILRNQSLPNQRSRQASCPVAMHGSTSSTRSSPIWSKNVRRDFSQQQRRWSVDNANERLPVVPAPYFRNESSSGYRPVKMTGEGPVMFSSPRREYKSKTITSSSTVVLNLDPDQFPEPTSRSPQLDGVTPIQNGSPGRGNATQKLRKPIVYKSSTHWNQRAPHSTPEPRLRNEMQMNSGKHNDLLPQVVPAQFRCYAEHRSTTSENINGKAKRKQSENSFDTSAERQSDEANTDRSEITEEALTERKRVLTSGEDSTTDCDYNDQKIHAAATNKRAEEQDLTFEEDSLVSSEDIEQKPATTASEGKPNEYFSDRDGSELSDPDIRSSMVENIDIQKLEINSIRNSNPDESTLILDDKLRRSMKESPLVDSRKSPAEKQNTGVSEMDEARQMDTVNVVVVNVTTDEGEDVNADIYEYEKGQASEQFEVGMESPDESSQENGQPAMRNRKEELEALLKEHSTIVEEVKNLMESGDA